MLVDFGSQNSEKLPWYWCLCFSPPLNFKPRSPTMVSLENWNGSKCCNNQDPTQLQWQFEFEFSLFLGDYFSVCQQYARHNHVSCIGFRLGWLIHSFIDWFIDWFVDWLVDWSIDWFIDLLVDWLIGWLVDWLIGWLIDWLIDWLVGWLIDLLARLVEWFIE